MCSGPTRVRADVPGTATSNPAFVDDDVLDTGRAGVDDLKERYRTGRARRPPVRTSRA